MAVNALPYFCFGALQTLSIYSRRLNGLFHTLRIPNFPQLFHLSYGAIIKEHFVKPRPPYCGRGHPPFKLSYKYNPASCSSCNFLFSIALISVNENQLLSWCMACFSHCVFFNMLFITICFKLFFFKSCCLIGQPTKNPACLHGPGYLQMKHINFTNRYT